MLPQTWNLRDIAPDTLKDFISSTNPELATAGGIAGTVVFITCFSLTGVLILDKKKRDDLAFHRKALILLYVLLRISDHLLTNGVFTSLSFYQKAANSQSFGPVLGPLDLCKIESNRLLGDLSHIGSRLAEMHGEIEAGLFTDSPAIEKLKVTVVDIFRYMRW